MLISSHHDKNNFGPLRLVAALCVLISHSFGMLQKPFQQPGLWYNGKSIILSDVGLYIFFTISGYLVTQSLFNSDSLMHYMRKRILRIMPALIVANLFCIFIGCFITGLRLQDYLFNKETWMYLVKNSTLVINQFQLPCVFTTLKDRTVNASLWTICVEVLCYIALLLAAYTIVTRRWLYLTGFVLFEALRVYLTVFNSVSVRGLDVDALFMFGTYFYLGSLMYCFKGAIRLNWFYANILMAVALATVYTFAESITLAIFFAYCFIVIGTSKSIFGLKGYDLSYGIYLYSFPVQQLVIFYSGYSINPWMHVAVSAILASTLALFSWVLVEKPFLSKKNVRMF